MIKRLIVRTAFILALLLFTMQLCACSCIQSDDNKGADPTKDANASESADLSEAPAQSDGASTDNTVPPDVFPTQQTEPNATPNGSGTPVGTDAPSGSAGPNNTAAPSMTPAGMTPAPSASAGPVQTPQPGETPGPTAAPVISSGLVWFDDSAPVYYDLDFDGKPEKVELSLTSLTDYAYSCRIKITVGSNGKELSDSFVTEYFTKAFINDFNSGDKRAEIVLCCGKGNRGQVTKGYRLNSSSSELGRDSVPGWVENVSGNGFVMGRYVDIMGTWACTSTFGFSRSDFAFSQQGSVWEIHRDADRWCTVSEGFLVALYVNSSSENYAGYLYPGDRIYPTATDLRTYIDFVSDLEDRGCINITKDSGGEFLINGRPMGDWFSDLSYLE